MAPPNTSTWEAKALALSAAIQAWHRPCGTILNPRYESPTSSVIQQYARGGDSAIWTGHYLAAEAFRYAVTSSNYALVNVRSCLQGLQSLVDVTGKDILARCLFPADWLYGDAIIEEEKGHGIYTGKLNGRDYLWVGNTSRDQYCGVFFGLGAAYGLVNDPSVRHAVRILATRLLRRLLRRCWCVFMPGDSLYTGTHHWFSTAFIGRPEQQLALLQIGRLVNPGRFEWPYKWRRLLLGPLVSFWPLLQACDTHRSYFKFNLMAISLFGLVRHEEPNSPVLGFYRHAYRVWRDTVQAHGNAHFNMIDCAVTGTNAARDSETLNLLDAWLKRPSRNPYRDLRGIPWNYAACPPPDDRSCAVVPVADRICTDFLWQRSPFLIYGGDDGTIERAGIDFILPYWMARYYGIVP
jgi:hypothetical protein